MFIVMTASEKMPSTCWGRYGKIAVVEVEDGFVGRPKMISTRARGVVRIVSEWRKLNIGSSERCAFEVAKREAEALSLELNAIVDDVATRAELVLRSWDTDMVGVANDGHCYPAQRNDIPQGAVDDYYEIGSAAALEAMIQSMKDGWKY